MKHHRHFEHYQVRAAKMNARTEAAVDFLVVVLIGIGLAVLLAAWWTV